MVKHHRVFSRFNPFSGEVPAFRQVDFLGTIVCREFEPNFPYCPAPITVKGCLPPFDNEYREWIDLLESVAACTGSYTMIELGAGYGRWAVRAAYAAKQFNAELPFHLITVEGEPAFFDWIRMHFCDNGIDPSQHRLIHAAVGDASDQDAALFYIGGPRGGPYDRKPGEWYGQSLTKDYDVSDQSEQDGEYHGYKVLVHKSGWRSVYVPSISLRGLLADLDRVDLIDMDIEGAELPVVRSAIEDLDAKVKRLHIGTHGKEIEIELRQILTAHGWCCHADYSLFSTNETPWGFIHFEDGVQSWVNPSLS